MSCLTGDEVDFQTEKVVSARWRANDPQSSVASCQWAIGRSPAPPRLRLVVVAAAVAVPCGSSLAFPGYCLAVLFLCPFSFLSLDLLSFFLLSFTISFFLSPSFFVFFLSPPLLIFFFLEIDRARGQSPSPPRLCLVVVAAAVAVFCSSSLAFPDCCRAVLFLCPFSFLSLDLLSFCLLSFPAFVLSFSSSFLNVFLS